MGNKCYCTQDMYIWHNHLFSPQLANDYHFVLFWTQFFVKMIFIIHGCAFYNILHFKDIFLQYCILCILLVENPLLCLICMNLLQLQTCHHISFYTCWFFFSSHNMVQIRMSFIRSHGYSLQVPELQDFQSQINHL